MAVGPRTEAPNRASVHLICGPKIEPQRRRGNSKSISREREMASSANKAEELKSKFGQIVLVFQGGGALGAYQAGVYEALHEAGIEPDWLIGTSIGAINATIIAGNKPQDR